jgi:hypothetical protein
MSFMPEECRGRWAGRRDKARMHRKQEGEERKEET